MRVAGCVPKTELLVRLGLGFLGENRTRVVRAGSSFMGECGKGGQCVAGEEGFSPRQPGCRAWFVVFAFSCLRDERFLPLRP